MGVLPDGKPDRRHVSAKTEAEVTKKVRDLERQRDAGRLTKPGRAWTVEKWLTHWLHNIAEPTVRRSTYEYYRGAVELYLLPGLGAHRMDRLEPEHVEDLYRRLRKAGKGSSTIQQTHRTLRVALNEAMRRDRIGRNPVMLVKSPGSTEKEIESFTVEEAQRLLTATKNRRNGVRYAVALSLGLRRGEALALKWDDFGTEWHHGCKQSCGGKPQHCPRGFQTGTLTIRRAIQRHIWRHGCEDVPCGRKRGADCPQRHGGGLVVTDTKSRAGRRVMNVPPQLLAALRRHQDAQHAERDTAANLWREDGWVFTQPNGRPVDPRADHDDWKALLKDAGVRDARLHDARHTAATMLLVLKVPTRAVMAVMGWSEASMVRRYQHVPDEIRQGIAADLDALLWGTEEDPDAGTEGVREPA